MIAAIWKLAADLAEDVHVGLGPLVEIHSRSLALDAGGWTQGRRPLLPLFPEHGNDAALAWLSDTAKGGVAEMGVGDQFACASLVAAFSLALFITANLFVESRAAKSVVVTPAPLHARLIPL